MSQETTHTCEVFHLGSPDLAAVLQPIADNFHQAKPKPGCHLTGSLTFAVRAPCCGFPPAAQGGGCREGSSQSRRGTGLTRKITFHCSLLPGAAQLSDFPFHCLPRPRERTEGSHRASERHRRDPLTPHGEVGLPQSCHLQSIGLGLIRSPLTAPSSFFPPTFLNFCNAIAIAILVKKARKRTMAKNTQGTTCEGATSTKTPWPTRGTLQVTELLWFWEAELPSASLA